MKTLKLISIALAGALLVLSACKKDDPTPTDKVTDACGNKYPVVKIGEQYWMAENLRCNKYANKSEAYNESWLEDHSIPTSKISIYTPYCTNASDKSNWYSSEHAGNLTDAQVKKLGYLYNWAAAVGVADGKKQTTAFSGNRQGICPNGWHIPSRAEWQALEDYIEKTKGKMSGTAGIHLKTTSSWYQNGNGSDTYGFAALPAGFAMGSDVFNVGRYTNFWSATPYESASSGAYYCFLNYNADYLGYDYYSKDYARSVRCLRD
ncbi:MAG: hypothetical protein MJ009_08000 [Paludibacteraceae bacterium]|nr:hypothetical protein [Paludibacteraceae bacterium]